MKTVMQTADRTLQEVLDVLIERELIPISRVGPIKTAIKQYAIILGYGEAAECPMAAFHLQDAARNRLIEEKAEGAGRRNGGGLGSHAIRNLKNNVSYVIRTATHEQIIGPIPGQFASSKTANSIKTKLITRRNEWVKPNKYVLDPVPSALAQEIADYESWATKVVNRDRPDKLKKRNITFSAHRGTLLRTAGYFVKYRQFEADSICLATLTEPDNAVSYIDWCIEQQGRFTAAADLNLARLIVLGKYLSIVSKTTDEQEVFDRRVADLRKFRGNLGRPETVIDKTKRWISLRNLETVGLSIYPLNARRISELDSDTRSRLRRDEEQGYQRYTRYAYRVLQSLLIRFNIRLPLRQRNLREMLWNPNSPEQGRNLYKREGKWHVRFSSAELKIAHVKGKVHRIEHEFPDDLVDLLEEWLSRWRPILISCQKTIKLGTEKIGAGQEFVFLDSVGGPLKLQQVTWAFESATFQYAGVAMNPHMVRTIWATEYIKSTKNFIDAAYMLGDKVETVLHSYANLLDEDCEKRAQSWLSKTLKDEPLSANGNGQISNDKLVKLLRLLKANLLEGSSDEQLLHAMKEVLK